MSPIASFEEDFNAIDESVWQIATWVEHGGQTGRERCYAQNGFLNLVFINDSGTYLSSAIQTRAEFGYGRWEARLKPSSVPGVLDSFYTIDWIADEGATQTQQEIDIEFLTYTFADEAGKVHYAVHANDRDSFETNPDIPVDFNPSEDFHVWGFEITPTRISWFVDGQTIQTYPYADPYPFIDKLYQLKLNTWSSTHWINGPPAPGVACIYQIDWIKFYPYDPDGTTTTTAPSSTTTTAGPSSTTTTIPAIPAEPCPAQNALGSDNPNLKDLRAFRDNTLARSSAGRRLIQMYYANADKINAALDRSPVLRAVARSFLQAAAPLMTR